ncbi:MAG: LytTR family DNA-binding domain-containing protein [Bacteroidota bacterium]
MSRPPLQCVIIDDEEIAVRVLKRHIEQVDGLEVTAVFYSGVEAYLELEKIACDVLFLDIRMPQLSGLSLLKMLKKRPLTVLTTAHRNFAYEGFELDVVDFLLKPIGFERFLRCAGKLLQLADQPTTPATTSSLSGFLIIKIQRNRIRIPYADILYLEAIRNRCAIVTTKQKYTPAVPLSTLEQELPEDFFLRVHRSFIINLAHVKRFNKDFVFLGEDIPISIGRSYRPTILPRLQDG